MEKYCGEFECVFYDTDDSFCEYCQLNLVDPDSDSSDCDFCLFDLVCDDYNIHC